jgi:protein phosphatase
MKTHPYSQRPMSRAERLYRSLLLLYPISFRRAYECEMLQTFHDYYCDMIQREGVAGLTRLWSLVLRDLIVTACLEHIRAGISFLKHLFGRQVKEYSLMSLLTLDAATRTDIGRTRTVNEDNVTSVIPEDAHTMTQKGALFVVADGMGGYTQGDVASELAIHTIRDAYYRDTNDDIAVSLRKAVEQANLRIFERNKVQFKDATEEITQKGMGTTCVAAVLKDNTVYVANAGDSLAYLIRAGQMRQIAENHSWVAEQVRTGRMTQAEADAEGKGNVITRCLGVENTVDVYVGTEQVQDRDILVLCTDGLHNQVSEDEIRTLVEQYGPEESAQRLIAHANENGGSDNITAVVIRISLAE